MLARDEDILKAAEDWKKAGRGVALATVVETWGSAPRPELVEGMQRRRDAGAARPVVDAGGHRRQRLVRIFLLERDPDERLGFEIDRLHRSCRRLIWLNPLLRFSGFEAKARGIRVMLPNVDELRPIHNLESMTDLCRALSKHGSHVDPKTWLAQVA